MAHTLGTLFHLPHGEACGIILPKVMRYNVDYATDALVQAARALDANTAGMEDRDAALAAAEDFWARLARLEGLSDDFRALAVDARGKLAAFDDLARRLPSRL